MHTSFCLAENEQPSEATQFKFKSRCGKLFPIITTFNAYEKIAAHRTMFASRDWAIDNAAAGMTPHTTSFHYTPLHQYLAAVRGHIKMLPSFVFKTSTSGPRSKRHNHLSFAVLCVSGRTRWSSPPGAPLHLPHRLWQWLKQFNTHLKFLY